MTNEVDMFSVTLSSLLCDSIESIKKVLDARNWENDEDEDDDGN